MLVAALAQRLEVGLCGRMLPHVHIHGRRQHHRAGEGQIKRRKEIAREPVGKLAQQVGRGGSDDEQVVVLRDRDVLDGAFDGEKIGENLAAGERGEGQRADELFGGRGHHGLHLVALLHEKAR